MTVSLLIVDDDEDYRLLVQLAVADDARLAVVGEASTTPEAMELVGDLHPDVVLLDLTLRDPDGRPPMSALADVSPGTGVISTSAYGGDPTASLPSAHHLGHLSKGVAPSALAQEILLLVEMMQAAARALDTATEHFPREPTSAAQSRRFVEDVLARWNCADAVDTVKLLVSELVGNAVSHASSEVEVQIELHPTTVRVTVGDDGTEVLRRREAGELDMSGRGLAILDTLAEAWGMTRRPSGKAVWFELSRSANGLGD